MRERSVGPQGRPEIPAGRIPMGPQDAPAGDQYSDISPAPERETRPGAGVTPEEPGRETEERPEQGEVLNTVPGSGNTANNPGNNITARTLEGGAGLER